MFFSCNMSYIQPPPQKKSDMMVKVTRIPACLPLTSPWRVARNKQDFPVGGGISVSLSFPDLHILLSPWQCRRKCALQLVGMCKRQIGFFVYYSKFILACPWNKAGILFCFGVFFGADYSSSSNLSMSFLSLSPL